MPRLRALDLFRGLTVAGMIVVNSSGSDSVFPWADHAPWHGFTPADLVFPSFLVVLGISAALSHAARRARGEAPAAVARHAAWRAAGLFGLGLLINFVVFREAQGIRWPGVLQRIAVCSLGASGFLLLDLPAAELATVALLLVGYWLALTFVPVPGHGAGDLSTAGNLASWLDRRLMGGHLETPLSDPEGILSTFPAFATALMGLIAGRRLVRAGAGRQEGRRLVLSGLAAALAGGVWSRVIPWNKHLWTSSYALTAGGLTLAGFGACLAAWPSAPPRALAWLESLGRRALAVYVGAGFVYGVLEFVPGRVLGGTEPNLKLWLNARLFASFLPPRAASLAFALCFAALAAAASRLADRGKDYS